MLELRREITVEGVPGTWTTNLNDDDVRAFHAQCGWQAPAEDNIKVGVFNRSVGFKFQDRTVPFKDGACQWVLLNERNWVIYRTTFEWEIWVARRQEIDELKEEQEQERATLSQLMRTENDHLRQLAREAVLVKDFVKAERHLIARAELAGEIERLKLSNWWSYGIIENARHWFSCFPGADNGIEFLRRYDRRAASFIAFADHFGFGNSMPVLELHAEIEKICNAAITLFPTDGDLFKRICLSWRRKGRIDLAIKYCKIAVERCAQDDTKSGFQGRLRRLEKEQS